MDYILKDFSEWSTLRPLTLTRSVADIRIGVLTIREKWNLHLSSAVSIQTEDYLQPLYPMAKNDSAITIRSSILPDKKLVAAIQSMEANTSLWKNGLLIAFYGEKSETSTTGKNEYSDEIINISYPWDIFKYNAVAIDLDFKFIRENRKSIPLSTTNSVHPIGNNNIFLEEGAKCENVFLNASEGPIYIGKNAEIMEGSMIRGPFAICNDSQLKMGTKIYGASTIGPHCKVGGEISNSVIFGYSNKAHDGFLGNSVIGEWCNLGADTNNSNLKNNYGIVKSWSYEKNDYIATGLQFCGLIMGDHSKSGINTMFNTGTVVGVNANIFGGGFPDTYIPSFSWGGKDDWQKYDLQKAFEVMEKVMERRKVKLSGEMQKIMTLLHSK